MNVHYLYLTVDLSSMLIPLIAAFNKRIPFNKKWRNFIPAIGITALVFVFWDIYFSRIHIWGFNPKYIVGIYCYNLPIEEICFFICIPYSCLFLYYCTTIFFKKKSNKIASVTVVSAALCLWILGAVNAHRTYTLYTFLLLGLLLIVLASTSSGTIVQFLISFAISLLPFLITDGILTGAMTKEPVVLYNDSHNLNIRFMTIPIEDFFYGMSFQLMNVLIFNSLQQHKNIQ